MESEQTLIWKEIRKFSSAINKAGGNTIALLLWSRDKSLLEVQVRIEDMIRDSVGGLGPAHSNRHQRGRNQFQPEEASDMGGLSGDKKKEEEERMALCLAEQQRMEGSQYGFSGMS